MKVRSYLEQLEKLEQQITRIGQRNSELRLMLECGSGIDYSKDKVQTSPENLTEKVIAEIDELDREIDRLAIDWTNTKAELVSKIDQMPKRQRDVLTSRYIDMLDINSIAAQAGISSYAARMVLVRAEAAFDRRYRVDRYT